MLVLANGAVKGRRSASKSLAVVNTAIRETFPGNTNMKNLRSWCAVLLLVSAGAAHAQAWIEYRNEEWRFAINFPEQPTAREVEWISEDDLAVPAVRFETRRGESVYSVTAADYREARLVTMQGSEAHTAANYRKLGEVTYDAYAQVDRIRGLQLQITKPDQRRLFVQIHVHDGILYVAEADVPPRAPPPGQFQQSLQILDQNGVRIRYTMAGQRLLSTEDLDIDPALISNQSLAVEDGFVTPEQYEELLRQAGN
jgi:hypothetical protein